jgi:hypothetical protein
MWGAVDIFTKRVNYKCLFVPTEGTGRLKTIAEVIMTPFNPSDLAGWINMGDRTQFNRLTLDIAKAWSSFVQGSEEQGLERRPENDEMIIQHPIDPNKAGIQGKQNLQRHQMRVAAELLWCSVCAMLTPQGMKMLMVKKKDFQYYNPDEMRVVNCGILGFFFTMELCSPSNVHVTTKYHEDHIVN